MLLSVDTVITGCSMKSITRLHCGLKHWVLDWIAGSYGGATKDKRGLVPCHALLVSRFYFFFSVAPQLTERPKETNFIFR